MRELQEKVHQLALEKGWWDFIEDGTVGWFNEDNPYTRSRSLPEQICLMHSELSEALESIRTDDRPFYLSDSGKPEGWAVELADCVIRIMDTLQYYQQDLQGLIELKHNYNATRPHRHGGKKL